MPRGSSSSGGVAEASGSNYEGLVAAWYCTRILLGSAAHPDLDLPSTTRHIELSLQSQEAVDDVNVITSDQGWILVQAKRSVNLSRSAESALARAFDQFVRQFRDGVPLSTVSDTMRPIDLSRDRLVLTTRNRAPKITSVLPRLLRRLRDRSSVPTLSSIAETDDEREVAKVIEDHVTTSWRAHSKKDPTNTDLGSILRAAWVQTLDVEDGETDRRSALDLMRSTVLANASQADLAFSALVSRCARLRAERSGADCATLQSCLSGVGIALVALPDFRADIGALRGWSRTHLQTAYRFTRLLFSDPAAVISRSAWAEFHAAADIGSFLVIGEPGAGKSGLTYRLASEYLDRGRDVVFIPVDVLAVKSQAELRSELGISRNLADILRQWPGEGRGLLVIDALDAARSLDTQTVIRSVIDDVIHVAGHRWNVVASVRNYDLRNGQQWQAMFRGVPVSPNHRDPEFPSIRHLAVQGLTDDEIAQTTAFSPALYKLFEEANPDLRVLLRNIFNLRLLIDLMDQGVVSGELAAIRTQSELLDTYWSHRVRRQDNQHDSRESALRVVIQRMIADRVLKIFRADVIAQIDASALVDLEQNGVLRAEEKARGANGDILLFTHHVLFDYALARLIFRRGRDASSLIAQLNSDRALAVMAAPSLKMAFADLWDSDSSRRAFWDVALAIAAESNLPSTALLVAPMTAAELAADITDLSPLLGALASGAAHRSEAEDVLGNLMGGINVLKSAGFPPIGANAGPWMKFAKALTDFDTNGSVAAVRFLVAQGTDDPAQLTAGQREDVAEAARRLLDYGLRNQ